MMCVRVCCSTSQNVNLIIACIKSGDALTDRSDGAKAHRSARFQTPSEFTTKCNDIKAQQHPSHSFTLHSKHSTRSLLEASWSKTSRSVQNFTPDLQCAHQNCAADPDGVSSGQRSSQIKRPPLSAKPAAVPATHQFISTNKLFITFFLSRHLLLMYTGIHSVQQLTLGMFVHPNIQQYNACSRIMLLKPLKRTNHRACPFHIPICAASLLCGV